MLGYFRFDANDIERMEEQKAKEKEYEIMKKQWQSFLPQQEENFFRWREHRNLVGKRERGRGRRERGEEMREGKEGKRGGREGREGGRKGKEGKRGGREGRRDRCEGERERDRLIRKELKERNYWK